jgi:two-component system CheB/CheR fusion protein
MHPNDLSGVVSRWNACIRQEISYQGEYRLKNIKTNEYRWFSSTTAPLKDDNGKVIKWIGSATDIHDQKMTEIRLENRVAERTKELKQLNEQLEKSNSELEQYAYVTSHDLKEPLRKIQTYYNLITAKYLTQLEPEVAEYLNKIASASSRMSGLIDDLLKYSRLSDPETSFDLVDLNNVVGQVSAEFEYNLRQKTISVDTGLLPVVRAVPIHMHQLFSNLFSNSIKFSKPDTPNKISITCSVLSEEEKASHVALKAPGRHYKIVFQDEGIGFSSVYSEKVFTIFQRLNNRNEFEGHGIGLALCRKIAGNHHGIILASGEENKGAVFTIILPERHES